MLLNKLLVALEGWNLADEVDDDQMKDDVGEDEVSEASFR